jgi:PTH1 family peptidyl-tRNA hydrolase
VSRFCFIGLGNPGPKYQGTRHNIGFDWVDVAVKSVDASASWSEKFNSLWTVIRFDAHELHFLKPQTFMNESGRAWTSFREKYQGDLRSLVVYDDLDLGLGELRYRLSGSDGGHRGLRSLIQLSGVASLERLRIGIGRGSEDSADFVLAKFTPSERIVLKEVLQLAGDHLKVLVQDQTRAMNVINAWRPPSLPDKS